MREERLSHRCGHVIQRGRRTHDLLHEVATNTFVSRVPGRSVGMMN